MNTKTTNTTNTTRMPDDVYYNEFGIALRKVTPIYNEGATKKCTIYAFLAEDRDGARFAYTWRVNDNQGLTKAPVVYARAWADENGIAATKITAYKTETGKTSEAREVKRDFLDGKIDLKADKYGYTIDWHEECEENEKTKEETKKERGNIMNKTDKTTTKAKGMVAEISSEMAPAKDTFDEACLRYIDGATYADKNGNIVINEKMLDNAKASMTAAEATRFDARIEEANIVADAENCMELGCLSAKFNAARIESYNEMRAAWGRESIDGFGTAGYEGSPWNAGSYVAVKDADKYNESFLDQQPCEGFGRDEGEDEDMSADQIAEYAVDTGTFKKKKTWTVLEEEAASSLKGEIARGKRPGADDLTQTINVLIDRGIADPTFGDIMRAYGKVLGKANSKPAGKKETRDLLGIIRD